MWAALLFLTNMAWAQCPDGITTVSLYSTDLETDDGSLTESGGGDWEYGDIPVVITGGNCGSSFASPGGAHSGTKGWGTVLDGCYNNLGAFSSLALTVDLSDPDYVSAELSFAHWFEVFVNFDYIKVTANGIDIYRNDTTEDSNGWLETHVDLLTFLGEPTVEIVFNLWASTVVNRAGWYLDDVAVTACLSGTTGIRQDPGQPFRAWPVPASGLLNVQTASHSGPVMEWALYDATGRVLAQGGGVDANLFQVDVSGNSGLAILELRTAQGILRRQVVLN
ncbi:MAG: hypothetical protein KBH07_08405 [Flavobacteriales bacterium]|nr:hypothetical protein [Flavobacteriales bacterium]MBP9080147.1 hypothetical protein [Flavobacteriales bacterium]